MPATFRTNRPLLTGHLAWLLLGAGVVGAGLGCSSERGGVPTDRPIPGFVRCERSVDCPSGYACTSGVCMSSDNAVATDGTCTSSGDCGAGLVCRGGACVATISQCEVDVECGFGDVCRRGRCTSARGQRCQSDSQCPGGRCVQRRCH